MTFLDIIKNYVVPVVGGVAVLFFISFLVWVGYKLIWKPFRIYDKLKNMMFSFRKKKILGDEKVIEYCVARIEKGWQEPDVREELLLANKYSSQKIDELIYAFNTIKKEMQGDTKKKKSAPDLP